MAGEPRPGDGLGIVVIGRNEGERLERCLRSIDAPGARLVYVDSGSTDGSIAFARSVGAHVVELDTSLPFTAARARNEGFRALATAGTRPEIVQFIDGDCELAAGWLAVAERHLESHPKIAVVCGRRRERDPASSVYNRLCDNEWNTPVGEAKACGGDAMMRAEAFEQVGGFRASLIAGEEPELCVRLRSSGWAVWRLDREMTLHDAAMIRFSQWWTRAKRGGYAFAEGARLHGAPPERHWVRERRRAILWGAFLPMAIVLLAVTVGWPAAFLLAAYPLQFIRLAARASGTPRARAEQALFLLVGKFAEAAGVVSYAWRHGLRRPPRLIEYK